MERCVFVQIGRLGPDAEKRADPAVVDEPLGLRVARIEAADESDEEGEVDGIQPSGVQHLLEGQKSERISHQGKLHPIASRSE